MLYCDYGCMADFSCRTCNPYGQWWTLTCRKVRLVMCLDRRTLIVVFSLYMYIFFVQGYQWLFDEQVIQYSAQGRDKSYEVRCIVAIIVRVSFSSRVLCSWLQKLLPEQSHRAVLPHKRRR